MNKKMQVNVQGDFAFLQEKKALSASGEIPDGLLYKTDQDLARVKERFAAFWRGEIVDRVCLAVTAPNGAGVPVPVAENDEQALTDPEFQVCRCHAEFANTWYGGDALPMAWAPGQLLYAAYGGKASFASGNEVVWIDPPGKNCPLYQRGHYRGGETLWTNVRRFVPAAEIPWC